MDIFKNEDLLTLRSFVRDFCNKEIKPNAAKVDREEYISEEQRRKIADAGLFGTAFPDEYGGGGFGETGFCVAQEEVTRCCGSTATMIGAHQSIGTNSIYIGGSEALKQKYLPSLLSGEKLAAFCLTEPEAGSDSFNLSTSAVWNGTHWILNGSKAWITNGSIADVFSVYARTERGITAFAVEKDFPGVYVGPNEKKLGIKGSVTNMITFTDTPVPPENMIGDDGRGILIAMQALDSGRIGLGACCLGAAKELLEMSVTYSKQRKQFGDSLHKFQAIQFMLAEMTSEIYLMESILYRAAQKYDRKEDVSTDAAIVKLICSEGVSKCADMALQIHGGMGFSAELPIERFYRDARVLKIFEGTNEIQKLIISRKAIKTGGKWVY